MPPVVYEIDQVSPVETWTVPLPLVVAWNCLLVPAVNVWPELSLNVYTRPLWEFVICEPTVLYIAL